jgi:hypothetical protein
MQALPWHTSGSTVDQQWINSDSFTPVHERENTTGLHFFNEFADWIADFTPSQPANEWEAWECRT